MKQTNYFKNMKNKPDQTLLNYINAQPNKDAVKPFNPDDYQWEAKGTKWNKLAVVML